MIKQLLAEIEARAAKASEEADTVIRRMARVNQRKEDIPRLVAALRVAVEYIRQDGIDDDGRLYDIDAALKGDAHAD